MDFHDLIDLFFGGMAKLGPGDDAHTAHVLRLLPRRELRLVVDAGCGTGRQTLCLSRELGTPIDAVDTHGPFLADLRRRAGEAGLAHLIRTHCMDMKVIPEVFREIDLLWSEGAAYNVGVPEALAGWASALAPGGLAAVSELSWQTDQIPATAREFFERGYPGMRSVEENVAVARGAGYEVLGTYTLPRESWLEGYYEILGPRAKALLDHADPSVREFAAETLKEIEVFESAGESYAYVFYLLRRP